MPWRQLAVLAVLALLVAIAAVVVAGARQERPAPLFGPARNGALLLSRDGDIVAHDRTSGSTTRLTTGAERDTEPFYSPDGTQLVFKRVAAGEQDPMLMVAKADGSRLRQVTDPAPDLIGYSFSPDGRSLLVTTSDHTRPTIRIVPLDGAAQPRQLEIPRFLDPDVAPTWHPANGQEILLIGYEPGASNRSLYAFDVTNGRIRTIAPGSNGADFWGGQWSPSGDRVLGAYVEPGTDTVKARLFTAEGQDQGVVDVRWEPGNFISTNGWSNHGTRLILGAGDRETLTVRNWSILSPDGSRPTVALACGTGGTGPCPWSWAWSPDDTLLVGTYGSVGAVTGYATADPDTGTITPMALEGDDEPSFQRLAP